MMGTDVELEHIFNLNLFNGKGVFLKLSVRVFVSFLTEVHLD